VRAATDAGHAMTAASSSSSGSRRRMAGDMVEGYGPGGFTMDRTPRVLLVEDDPVSCSVFTLALERSGAQVDACDSLRSARAAATQGTHDLWLVDAHLPDGDGIALLIALRGLGLATRAIAHTASRDASLHARLREAGYADVLVKPLPAAEFVAALGLQPAGVAPLNTSGRPVEHVHWDDAQALRALGGSRDSLVALRTLFLQELPESLAECRDAVHARDDDALRTTLHRLQASCAFVGASALLECARVLRETPGLSALAAFEREADALLTVPERESA
jgi:CheY-like chemotaxis protein